MQASMEQKFLDNNKMLKELPGCDLKPGDIVTFTNEFGVIFHDKVVIGFSKPEQSHHPEHVIHIADDTPVWFPVKRSELKIQQFRLNPIKRHITVTYSDKTQIIVPC